jgi:hypothetical protein
VRGRPQHLLGFTDRAGAHEVTLGIADFLADPSRGLGTFAVFRNADGSTTMAQTPLATSLPMTITGDHQRGTAVAARPQR